MKILLIDDSRTMRDVARSILVQLGDAEVLEAASGEDGLVMARSVAPDLILVDERMPGMGGLAFVRAFRDEDGKTPVVVIGTDNRRERVAEAIKAGASNYLAKPYTPDLLSQRVQETLSTSTLRRAS